MKLLLDENLSPRLVERLKSLYSGITHVRDVGLNQASDHLIWKWALDNGCTVVTADSDFVGLSERLGSLASEAARSTANRVPNHLTRWQIKYKHFRVWIPHKF